MRDFLFLFVLTLKIFIGCDCIASADDDLRPVPDSIGRKSGIHLPVVPVIVEPDVIDDDQPAPVPPPNPGPPDPVPVTTLSADQWYVIESDIPLMVLSSPTGFVTVQADEGPMRVRGRFADGTGTTETRTYQSKHLYFVNAVKTGTIELLIVPVGVSAESDIVRQPLTVTVGPRPPPVPPGPEPIPPGPGPDPIPGDGNRVLIIYEASDLASLPASQSVLFTSGTVRDYLQWKCSKGPDGKTPEFRIWDKDVDTTNVSQVWKDALALPRNAIPWLIVSNGVAGYSGPLPTDQAALLSKLKIYLGE